MEQVFKRLQEKEPWTKYRTKIDLLGLGKDDPEVKKDYSELINNELIEGLLKELDDWPGKVVKRHNDAALLYHKLAFLVDIGLGMENPGISKLTEKMLASQSTNGPFQVIGNIPTVFGGSGLDEEIWMLCDAPLITYSLVKLGMGDNKKVKESISYLLSIQQDFGWPCAASSVLGKKFKGPGKRTDPCPYANLLMLRLLSILPEMHNRKETERGIDAMLDLWEFRKEVKYFLFGMGTDFCKLKAPFIWYDILHVVDVLSNFEKARKDKRFLEMVNVITNKVDEEGSYKAESVFRAWKDWDFGQKKESSSWITFLVYRIIRRIENN